MDVSLPAALRMTTTDLLERQVSFDTTSRHSNLAVIGFVREYLDGFGVPYRVSTDLLGQCGPGYIAQAHQADEWIATSELGTCDHFVRRLADRLLV